MAWLGELLEPAVRLTGMRTFLPVLAASTLLLAACGNGGGSASDPAPSEPTDDGATPTARPRIEVVDTEDGIGRRMLDSAGEARATWLATSGRLVYVTELGYSSCAPTARIGGEAGALRLAVTPYAGPDMCAMLATHYAVVVDGLGDSPGRLEVTDLSGTSVVEVGEVGEG